jgi:predicted acylesterase/phospholipase RssA
MNESEENRANDGSAYVEYDTLDLDYFGAADVVGEEKKYIRIRRGLKAKDDTELENLTGLALSGGGIRSASFSLGIMQALAHRGWLKKIDYLSTVSGGGYIGSSLIWLLKSNADFGMEHENFPLASYPMSSQSRLDHVHTPLKERLDASSTASKFKGRLLRFIRQNARYLNPGRGINLFSLAGLALRGGLVGIAVYGGLVTLLLWLFIRLGAFDRTWEYLFAPEWLVKNFFLDLFFWGLVIYLVSIPVFALITIFSGNGRKSPTYWLRRGYEVALGYLLPTLICLAILGSLPIVRCALIALDSKASPQTAEFTVSGRRTSAGGFTFNGVIKPNPVALAHKPAHLDSSCSEKKDLSPRSTFLEELYKEMYALGAGLGALALAFISALGAFFKTGRLAMKKLPLGPLVAGGILLLVYGQLLTSYSLLVVVDRVGVDLLWAALAITTQLILACINLNHLSLHRFYRDRLMETFLPNVYELLDRKYETAHIAEVADRGRLHTMGAMKNGKQAEQWRVPYHIINTNVVLVSSCNPKYRGRGGDSFILSPAFCGSNATGWRATSQYMEGSMTLATAMAISGAAVNPSAGCGGEGITRSPFISALMGMLNLRLGYWASNPDSSRGLWRKYVPSSILPGLFEISFRNFLNESSRFVQLSDGGHFENLGLYELVRRRLRLIIVCDGGADPDFTFSELANAMEKVRSDFGALIMLESEQLARLVPGGADAQGAAYAERPYLVAKVVYADGSEGRLIYITTTFFKQLGADLYGYRKEHPAFPDEPTADQFFDEKQFEAYRELGFQAAWAMMRGEDIARDAVVHEIMNSGR